MNTTGRPFVGADAIAAGVVTDGVLRGRRYRTVFRGIHVEADQPDTYPLRCEAGFLLVRGAGVLAGHSAAEMQCAPCAPCAPMQAPVEVVVPDPAKRRHRPGLIVHRDALLDDEVVRRVPVRVRDERGRWRILPGRHVDTTSPLRTAFDLARREPRIEAVVALDALGCHCAIDPSAVLTLALRHPGVRGVARLAELVALSDRRAESPMETRVRLALIDGGLPLPILQFPFGPYRFDMAYPAAILAVEYDGAHHRTAEQARRDLERQAFVDAHGWTIVRPPDHEVLGRPDAVAARVRDALAFRRHPSGRR